MAGCSHPVHATGQARARRLAKIDDLLPPQTQSLGNDGILQRQAWPEFGELFVAQVDGVCDLTDAGDSNKRKRVDLVEVQEESYTLAQRQGANLCPHLGQVPTHRDRSRWVRVW